MTSHDFWPSIIDKIKEELAHYDTKRIWPSLRQMFYRLVSKELIANTNSMYTKLSAKTARAREDGTLPMDCFYDDAQIININDKYLTPEQTIDDYLGKLEELPDDYKGLPKWYNQPEYVEIWIEKNAMVSEFRSIMDEAGLEVRLVPHGGYVSLSQLSQSVNRLYNYIAMGKNIRILYFGDFDPSGVQMFDDIKDRLVRVWKLGNGRVSIRLQNTKDKTTKEYIFEFEIQRIAVNKEHIAMYDLPSEPLDAAQQDKIDNDTRTDKFVTTHGRVYATELDALPIFAEDPFKDMVIDSVSQYFDEKIYNREVKDHKKEHSKKAIKALVKMKIDEFANKFTSPIVD